MIYSKKLKGFAAMTALASAVFLAACGGNESGSGDEEGTKTFKIAHVTQETHIWHQTAEKFGEELEKLSDGKMKVEIYPASQLGQEKDMVQQLETGSLDFGFLTNAYMSTREVSLNAWFMPFVFPTIADANEMRDAESTKKILDTLDSQGLVAFDFVFAGNRHVLLNDGFVQSPADLKGKKLRIVGSPAMQEFWEKAGAGPTAMPLSEVYTSLQTGVIDGIDIDLDALVTEKYYENAENLTLTNQMAFPAILTMSQTSFDALSTEEQEIVTEAIDIAADWGNEEAIKREETNLQTLKDAGVKVEELKDSSTFDEVSNSVIDKYSTESELIKEFLVEAQK